MTTLIHLYSQQPKPKGAHKNCTLHSFFSILWCKWSGDQPQDDLARFGNKKHESSFLKHPFKILATYWNLGYNMGIFFFKFWQFKKKMPFSSFWKKISTFQKIPPPKKFITWNTSTTWQPNVALHIHRLWDSTIMFFYTLYPSSTWTCKPRDIIKVIYTRWI